MNPVLQTTTQAVDTAFYVIFGISGVALLGVMAAMLWFAWRYNRKRCPVPLSQKDHNVWLEITWTVIPTVLVMLMFWYGWEGYLSLRRIPDEAMHIKGAGRMWSWLFTYDNGRTADKLYVPVGRPVKIELTAEDVLHSFYVPAFRVKRDMVPGMTNWVWFTADRPGSFDLFCAEYCGVGHSQMVTTVEALPEAEFSAWLEEKPVEGGQALLQKHGCLGCHSLDGSRLVGPTFQGIAGRRVDVVSGGQEQTLMTDADYLRRSILEPNDEIVEGYPPAMPSYAGRIPDEELTAIIDHLMSLSVESPEAAKEPQEKPEHESAETAAVEAKEHSRPWPPASDPVQQGEALAGQLGCLNCHSIDGTRQVGPSLKGIYGQPREVQREGRETTITADAAYLERAIREPAAEIVDDYPPAMPSYAQLGDADIQALIAWMKELR